MASRQERQRQKARARKKARDEGRRARRSEIRRRQGERVESTERSSLQGASEWPVRDCMISFDWEEGERPADLVLSRQHSDGRVAAAFFAVDIGCLGVKRAWGRAPIPGRQYLSTLEEMSERSPMMEISTADALKILETATAWGDRFGFSSHPDYQRIRTLFGETRTDASRLRIECGRDGQPFYVPEEGDDVEVIEARLAFAQSGRG